MIALAPMMLAMGLFEIGDRQMQITLGRGERAMTKGFLDAKENRGQSTNLGRSGVAVWMAGMAK